MWLKGDFHAHSTLSDGVLPPDRFIAEAEREQLDFFAITDHNVWSYPAFADSPNVLVIAGVEVTMPYGHFNVFSETGTEPDWITTLPEPPAVEREAQRGAAVALVEAIASQGLRASINHPLLFPWEWTDDAAPLSAFRYLEVWNDPTWPENKLANPAALDMWTKWLNAGLRVTAVGGSDFHNPEKLARFDGLVLDGHRVGMPRSFVDAEAATPSAILEAADRGRVYVTMGPRIEFVVESAAGIAGPGESLGVIDGPLWVTGRAWGDGSLDIRVVVDGKVAASAAGFDPVVEHRVDPDPQRPIWIRIDVADPGGVVAFSNPVFCGPDPEPPVADYGTFTDVTAALAIQERWQAQHEPHNQQEEHPPWRQNVLGT